jgi:hypothetical protein
MGTIVRHWDDAHIALAEPMHRGCSQWVPGHVTRQSVYRIRSEPEKQIAALRAWYPEELQQ